MTKKMIAIIIISAVLLSTTVGGVVAYMIKIIQGGEKQFEAAKVSCTLNETFVNDQKSNVTVTNTSNVDVFVRVRLVTYWVDGSGNVVNEAPANINFALGEDWIKSASSNTYYCKEPLAKGGTTSDLLNGQKLTLVSKNGYKQVIEVFAEVIQANPAQAAQEGWGVTITNNQINSAP